MSEPAEMAFYLYCLTPSGRSVEADSPSLDERHPVLVRECKGTGAVYSRVELEDFAGPTAEDHIQDLAWLGPRVCRHEAVVEQIMVQAPVLPAPFATLFASLEGLENFVGAHREAIGAFFAQLGDKQEWAVKGFLDRAAALEKLSKSVEPSPDRSPGARYFEQKRLRAQAEREVSQRLRDFCQRAAVALGVIAGGFRERKVIASEAGAAEVMSNWAFLIAPAQLGNFQACMNRLNSSEGFPGFNLALIGPWPPFSFVPNLSADASR